MTKAAIFILTQNTEVRKVYLKNSLYFLFRNFNSQYKYPVIIFHEGDYDEKSQREILHGVREEGRGLIKFKELDKNDFSLPSHIDENKMKKSIENRPVPYWRNDKYRMMCRWWLVNFQKYFDDYDYVMRLDDDSIIEEPITEDLFDIAKVKDFVYVSNLVHVDCALCCYGMKEFFEEQYPAKKEDIAKLFTDTKLPLNSDHFKKFNKVHEIVEGKPYDKPEFVASMPIMYYNNFFITETAFWKRNDVLELINRIDKNGSIFYYRWGDAPLHTLITMLLAPGKTSRTVFKYSKRLQRETFVDDDGNFHSFMPKNYTESSCVSQRK